MGLSARVKKAEKPRLDPRGVSDPLGILTNEAVVQLKIKRYKTKSGQTTYIVRYRDPSGRARSKSLRTMKEARQYRSQVEADKAHGRWIDPAAGKISLREYALGWVRTNPSLKDRTRETYRSQLENHVLPVLGTTPLIKLSGLTIRSWYGDLREAGTIGPNTAAKVYRLLRSILATAVREDLIAKNPCSISGAGNEEVVERPVLSIPEVFALADKVDGPYRALILLAAFSGLRWGELAGLARCHVNPLHGRIEVERQLVEAKGDPTFGPPKSAAGYRTVAIPAEVCEAIDEHIELFAQPGPDGLVFVTERGRPLRRSNFNPRFRDACRQAGIADEFTFHDLRHSSMTLAAASGASLKELMRRMGHASPRAALRYQHATEDRDRVIADAIGQAITKSREAS